MNANELVNFLNEKMSEKSSDVRFYWSGTYGNAPDAKSYFLLWGYLDSHFTYSYKKPRKSVFLFKGMATMIEDNFEFLDSLEDQVMQSFDAPSEIEIDTEGLDG